jgi:hypothetical protein
VTSCKYPGDSLKDVEERWTLKDVYDAHEFLNIMERLERREAERVRDSARKRGHR